MKKVVTFGVFDCLHYGHVRLFKKCKDYGDFLIVAVHDDDHIYINKPNCKLYYNEDQRFEMVDSIKFVDETIFYTQIDETIQMIDFDVLVVGPDQNNEHFTKAIEYCKINNKRVVVLPRTPNISSTMLRHGK